MKIYLISYATPEYYKSQKLLNKSALRNGVDECLSFSRNWLKKTKFYSENIHILKQYRGSGFWLWKPYIILETLKKIDKDDILIYSDSGIEIISDLTPIIEISDNTGGLTFFNNIGSACKNWTKRDCFIEMDADSSKYYEAEQVIGGFSLYKKNERNIKFVEEWLFYGTKKNLITDSSNICGKENIEGFIEHRHDQSILSILVKKWELEVFRYPVLDESNLDKEYIKQYPNSNFQNFINLHRIRQYTIKDFFRLKIKKIKQFLRNDRKDKEICEKQ